MAHAQKPDFVFRRNGRVHLNRRGRQFSWLLAAEVWASAVVMLDTPSSEVVWRVLATHSIRQFPLHFPPVRHRVPSGFKRTLPTAEHCSLLHQSGTRNMNFARWLIWENSSPMWHSTGRNVPAFPRNLMPISVGYKGLTLVPLKMEEIIPFTIFVTLFVNKQRLSS